MKYLLDTHIIIWLLEDTLTPKIYDILEHRENNIYLSSASLWEIAIKINLASWI